MSNNLQGDDDSMPALVSAGEDLPAGEGKEEESQGVTKGNKVSATFIWYPYTHDLDEPVTLLTSEKVRRNVQFVYCVYCVCVHAHLHSLSWYFRTGQVNNGSVDLYPDATGEFFGSAEVLVEKGTHEGQLCYKYNDGYEEVYPVKPFKVERENDAVILTLDVQRRRGTLQCACSGSCVAIVKLLYCPVT